MSADYFLQNSEHSYRITFVPAEWQTGWMDLDQAQHFVGPDLAPNCLHRLSADDISRNRDPENLIILFVYQVQMTELHGSYKSIGTEMNSDVTVIWSL